MLARASSPNGSRSRNARGKRNSAGSLSPAIRRDRGTDPPTRDGRQASAASGEARVGESGKTQGRKLRTARVAQRE